MSPVASRRVAPLVAALVLAGCGLDFSTPRAYRCGSDEECRGGWRCLGDSYCHDPAVGVATPCGVDGDCAGSWRCLGDKVCHDPGVGVATACATDADCAGGWQCLGDKLCHDGTVGVTLACVTDGDCAAGWLCLGDKLCHDPALGVTTPCVVSSDCAGGWQCLGDKLCHDPALGVATPCVVSSDCAGGWQCLGDNVCHDPALGVTTRCVADGDCAGGWVCLNDNLCHDPAVGVTTPCVVDGDCAASWRCLGDKLCHDPDAGAATPCLATADCAGGWRCADRLCRDPAVGVTVPCSTSADCLGGWFCGRDRVCRDPNNPGPFPCATDAECAGGWRCSTEGVCTDAAAELARVPPGGASPGLSLVSPKVELPRGLRVAAAGLSLDDAGLEAVFPATTVGADGLLVTSLRSSRAPGASGYQHEVEWNELPLGTDAGVVLDALSTGEVTLVLTSGLASPVVWRSLQGQPLAPLPLASAPSRLISFPRGAAPGQVRPLLAVVTDGDLVVAWPDGGVTTWGDAAKKARVIDVVSSDRDGGPLSVAWSDGTAEYVGDSAIGQPLDSAGALWSGGLVGGLELTRLRTRGDFFAGAWKTPGGLGGTGSVSWPASIDGGATPPIYALQEYAEVLSGVRIGIPRSFFVHAECPFGETLEDFELVETGGELGLEIACRNPAYPGLLVYVATPLRPQRLVFERRSVLHDGLDGTHASVTANGVVRFSAELAAPDLSTLLSMSPAVLGRVDRFLVAVAGAQVYGHDPRGLALSASETDPLAAPVGLVERAATLIVGYGAGIDFSAKPPQVRFALEGTPTLHRARGRQFGQATIVSGDDTLYAGTLRDAGVAVLRSVLRPAPGFPVDDWVVRPADGGYEGWLVGNNQLFVLQANTLDRWRSSTWPVSGRDVLGVWWAGAGARVGTTSGEVFSLPSRVPVAPSVPGGVTSFAGHCGDVVAVGSTGLLRLEADAGWAALDASVPRALREPRLVETDEGLFVVDDDGVVLELAFPVAADGGCP